MAGDRGTPLAGIENSEVPKTEAIMIERMAAVDC